MRMEWKVYFIIFQRTTEEIRRSREEGTRMVTHESLNSELRTCTHYYDVNILLL